jgi:hypothetical protein
MNPAAPPETSRSISVLYCADCSKIQGSDTRDRIGLRYICKSNDPYHIACIVKKPHGSHWPAEWWMRRERDIRWWVKNASLMMDGDMAVFWAFVRLALLALTLAAAVTVTMPCRSVVVVFVILFAVYNIADLMLLSTHAIFVSRFPAHPLRTVVLTLLTFLQLAVVYSMLYALMPKCFDPPLDRFVSVIYFSVVTIATVGFGDFRPKSDALLAQSLVVSEIVLGLFVLAVLVAVAASWANESPRGRPTFQSLVQEGYIKEWQEG